MSVSEAESILMDIHKEGHIGFSTIIESIKKNRLSTGTQLDHDTTVLNKINLHRLIRSCATCICAKMVNKSFPLTKRTFTHIGEVISTDLAVGLPRSLKQNAYLAIFIGSYSKFVWVKPLTSKSEAQNYIPKLVAFIRCQTERTVKTIQSDNGGEFAVH